MQYLPAFILGLIGSLHCAGMCGPLAMALPVTGHSRISFTLGRAAYNLGRITTYCLIGAIFGAIGLSFVMAGFQRWASLLAGTAILIGLVASSRRAMQTPLARALGILRSKLGPLMKRPTYGSLFML